MGVSLLCKVADTPFHIRGDEVMILTTMLDIGPDPKATKSAL